MKSISAAAALALAAAQPASAQHSATGEQSITAFDELLMIEALDEIDATLSQNGATSDGTTIYKIEFANGIIGFGFLRACEDECYGMVVAASFTRPENATPEELNELLRKFNDSHAEIKVYIGEDGDPMAPNYLIADGGISMKNMSTQLKVFADSAKIFGDQLYADE